MSIDWQSPLSRRRALLGCGLAALIALTGCGSDSSSSAMTSAAPILFSPEGNNLWAYETTPPFVSQKVNAAYHTFDGTPGNPAGWDINGEVCTFRTGGRHYLVAGEDTFQPDPPAGWGIFELTGNRVGELALRRRIARLVPTYQDTAHGPDNYGCGVLSDGRILTTDIGNEAGGAANGQLVMWFPPFNGDTVSFCKLDVQLATGQGIYVDRHDNLYLNSPRTAPEPDATAAGVFKYSPPYPTSADARGGCGRVDNLGSPLADTIRKERVLAAPDHGLATPSGIAAGPNGHFFVASVLSGVINEYDANWQYVQTVLRPAAGDRISTTTPYATGTPLGITVGKDGTLYYADIGIIIRPTGPGPGNHLGTLRRITFNRDGTPNPPETIADNLQFPDGLGLWHR
ncbi:hypothetical protein KF840_26360 [bacterium]|nr:hypothetical protein [bacterium]